MRTARLTHIPRKPALTLSLFEKNRLSIMTNGGLPLLKLASYPTGVITTQRPTGGQHNS